MCSLVFFNDTATTEIFTLSLHDALPICSGAVVAERSGPLFVRRPGPSRRRAPPSPLEPAQLHFGVDVAERVSLVVECEDRKSTRLNSSHANISYAVFCLKKKLTGSNCIS